MRFVAIFNQHQVPHALGFTNSVEALDFLFWGYEDQQLLPYGIYDKFTDQVTTYTHAGQLVHTIKEESIRVTVKRHLALTHRPATSEPS
ncbi:hypothetical protein [Spirosoma agri]|uniref:Uncharacterized protein n=1 Tax=Spirosoma agri TaxID=1987381 RepID=A0A6M0ICD2_9BACT|nr:hypothetical protein [Spirosoma agri]NEU65859.1 hypothetical protein [Spirosoma agri]